MRNPFKKPRFDEYLLYIIKKVDKIWDDMDSIYGTVYKILSLSSSNFQFPAKRLVEFFESWQSLTEEMGYELLNLVNDLDKYLQKEISKVKCLTVDDYNELKNLIFEISKKMVDLRDRFNKKKSIEVDLKGIEQNIIYAVNYLEKHDDKTIFMTNSLLRNTVEFLSAYLDKFRRNYLRIKNMEEKMNFILNHNHFFNEELRNATKILVRIIDSTRKKFRSIEDDISRKARWYLDYKNSVNDPSKTLSQDIKRTINEFRKYGTMTIADIKDRMNNWYFLDKGAVGLNLKMIENEKICSFIYPTLHSISHPMSISTMIRKEYHQVRNPKGIYVIFPLWFGKLFYNKKTIKILNHWGYNVLEYECNPNILSSNIALTLKYFKDIMLITSEHIASIKKQNPDFEINMISVSLGNVKSFMTLNYLAKQGIYTDRLVSIVPGDNLAHGLWYGIRTQDFRREFEAKGISFSNLNKAWSELHPINNVSGMSGTAIHLAYSPADLIIRPTGIQNLIAAMKNAGAKVQVDSRRFGHGFSIVGYINNPSRIFDFVKKLKTKEIKVKTDAA